MAETNGMQALAEYGYVTGEDGVMYSPGRRNSQRWKLVEDGMLRFDMEQGQMIPVPYKLKDEFKGHTDDQGRYFPGVSGLDFRKNPNCFDWVWPEPVVANIYAVAKQGMDEYLRGRAVIHARQEEPVSEAQLDAMYAAQQPEVVEPEPKKRGFFHR